MDLLPTRVARNFYTQKWNVIYDDISILLGIEAIKKLKVTLDFPDNLKWTPEKRFTLTRLEVGHRI